MDRYDPYTDKFLRDTQYNILGTNLAEVSTDLISRQDAIDALREYLINKRVPEDGTLTARLIENEVINKLPSAEPQERKGKWININNGKWNTIPVYKCSACGEIDNRVYETDRYCSNCGAKMEVNHESN